MPLPGTLHLSCFAKHSMCVFSLRTEWFQSSKSLPQMHFFTHLALHWLVCITTPCICGCCIEKRQEHRVVQNSNSDHFKCWLPGMSRLVAFHPQNCLFPWGDLDPHLIHGSMGPPESIFQTAPQSVQLFLQGSRSLQTDRQTSRLVFTAQLRRRSECPQFGMHWPTF